MATEKIKKVLLISPLPPPVGGIASWTVNVLDYIEKNKIEYIDHLNSAQKNKRITNTSVLSRIYWGIINTASIIKKFTIYCSSNKYDVTHITTSGSYGLLRDLLFLYITKYFKIKCIFHIRFGRIPALKIAHNWEWRLIKHIIAQAHKSIIIDTASYKAFCEIGLKDKVILLPNPCSEKVENIARNEIQFKKDNSFLFVGHVTIAKGVYELVKTFSESKAPLKLTIIGPYENNVYNDLYNIAKTKQNGEWLFIIGVKSKNEILKFMQTSTALILPSYTEGFPNVVLESMASGCPVLASEVGAIPEMLDIKNCEESAGICFKSRSITSLRNALLLFLSKSYTDQTRYGRNGKTKVIKHYTMSRIFQQYSIIWKS